MIKIAMLMTTFGVLILLWLCFIGWMAELWIKKAKERRIDIKVAIFTFGALLVIICLGVTIIIVTKIWTY